MRKVLCLLIMILPAAALAGHGDVIEVELKDGCSFETYLAIKDDFNTLWGSKNGYKAEVFMPVHSDNLTSVYWVGRSANTAAFGKAWDQWVKDLGDPDSTAAKLWARFLECSTNVSRVGYDVY